MFCPMGHNLEPKVCDRNARLARRTIAQAEPLGKQLLAIGDEVPNRAHHEHDQRQQLAVDVLGAEGDLTAGNDAELRALQNLCLWSRCDTIYAGTNLGLLSVALGI